MNRRALFGLVCFLPAFLFSGQTVPAPDLPEQYRDWLKLTQAVILPVEREIFLKLTSAADRDAFIATFWKQRDPTPETPKNEYREELLRRFAYANSHFGRASVREGWMTDMGRIHMILGAPVGIERFENSSHLVPCQAWTYYGDPRKKLPASFVLLFFQKSGVGEYKLYDPLSDGPAALLLDKRGVDPTDASGLYEKIRELAPSLADISLSLVPGESRPGDSPSTRNSILLADILESPKKDVNVSYARHFLDYKGVVSTEYLTNFIESDGMTALIRDPATGVDFLHFSIVPQSLSVDYYEPKNRYFCGLRLDVSLRAGESAVFQYTKDLALEFDARDADRFKANGISVEDSFPVIAGKFRLIVLLQNSVGKEFSILEKDISIPSDRAGPALEGPVLGYRIEAFPEDRHIPFTAAGKKILLDPKMTFSGSDDLAFLFNVLGAPEDLRKGGEVRIGIRGLGEKNPVRKSSMVPLAGAAPGPVLAFSHRIPARELPPDYYELKLGLADAEGNVLDEGTANFIVSPEKAIAHPIVQAKGFPAANRYVYDYIRAGQADRTGADALAAALYERAFTLHPGFAAGAADYAGFLIRTKAYARALEVIDALKEDGKRKYDYFLLKGRAEMGQGDFRSAIGSFLEGKKIDDGETRLLNLLGACYVRTGQNARALEVFEASLRIKPGQTDIAAVVAGLRKRKAG
ncbi:MAG: GWxTD domain-containing protein [Candidatus Aminicenantales bacterium]